MAAKKKDKDKDKDKDGGNIVDIHSFIEKNYGRDIISPASSFMEDDIQVVPWSPALNTVIGGVPEGSWVSVAGLPKVGKTTSLLHFAAQAQKPENGNKDVYYLNIEGRLKKMNLSGIKGLNQDKFFPISSQEGKILSAEDYLEIAGRIIKDVPKCVIILDSITSLCGADELDGDMNKVERGGSGVRLMAKFCRKYSNVVPVNKTIVCGIVQMMSNVTGYGSPWTEKGGNSWKYQSDIRLIAKSSKGITNTDGKEYGSVITWLCDCAALQGYRPGSKVESYLRYGEGIDEAMESVQLAISLNIIKKSGAWYYLDENKYQGIDNLRTAFIEDETFRSCVQQSLAEFGL